MLPTTSRRAIMAGAAATAALYQHAGIGPHVDLLPSPTLAALIAERCRLSDTWTAEDIDLPDAVGYARYGRHIDALEYQITSYRPNGPGEAVQAIDFILAEARNGTAALCDVRCGGWGADLYHLLEASRNAIGGAA